MSESIRISKWIYSTLAADAAVSSLIEDRIYRGRTPSGAAFPHVRFNLQSGRDVNGTGGVRILTRPLYQIIAVGRGNLTMEFISLATRVDEIFQNKRAEIFEGFVFSSAREQAIDREEQGAADADIYYTNVGGLYRIDCYQV